MRAVIMGCGRVGSRLAQLLYGKGFAVAVIDEVPEAFRRLDPAIDVLTVTGTAIDEDVQRAAGIEEATIFAAVTNRDNSNLMAAQVAKHVFNVPVVTVRIYDPVRGEVYHDLGIDTVSPTTIIADLFFDKIMQQVLPKPAPAQPAAPQVAPAQAQPAPATPPTTPQRGDR